MKFYIRSAILICWMIVGCGTDTGEPSAELPAAPNAPDDVVPADSIDDAYPEQPEVNRLLFLARDAMNSGQFEEALAIVENALQIDPASSRAKQMKQRITDILVRS